MCQQSFQATFKWVKIPILWGFYYNVPKVKCEKILSYDGKRSQKFGESDIKKNSTVRMDSIRFSRCLESNSFLLPGTYKQIPTFCARIHCKYATVGYLCIDLVHNYSSWFIRNSMKEIDLFWTFPCQRFIYQTWNFEFSLWCEIT